MLLILSAWQFVNELPASQLLAQVIAAPSKTEPTEALTEKNELAAERIKLVSEILEPSGIRDKRVLSSIATTPRHLFMPHDKRGLAYFDMAVPIGYGQTISPPYIVAFMTEQLRLKPADRVLEIGTGSGYQAAVLSPLVKEVYTIEIVPELGRSAAKALSDLRYTNVHCRIGDGYKGWQEHAPFNHIIVTCSPESIPQPLIDQLIEGGSMVIPVGSRVGQTLVRFTKRSGQMEPEPLQATFFVPMTGQAESNRTRPVEPAIAIATRNGSFEAHQNYLPDEWYYLRQCLVVARENAPSNGHYLRLSNTTEGRLAQALHAIQVDSLLVEEAWLSFQYRGEWLENAGEEPPSVFLEFYNQDREPCGHTQVELIASSHWKSTKNRITLPAEADFAVLGISLFGVEGHLDIDDVMLSPIE